MTKTRCLTTAQDLVGPHVEIRTAIINSVRIICSTVPILRLGFGRNWAEALTAWYYPRSRTLPQMKPLPVRTRAIRKPLLREEAKERLHQLQAFSPLWGMSWEST